MKLNKIKQTLCALFSVVLTTLIILAPIEVKAEGWDYSCDKDEITGKITGHVYSPLGKNNKRDIDTRLFYTQTGNLNYSIYLSFDYLHPTGRDGNDVILTHIFKPHGEPGRQYYKIVNSRWLLFTGGNKYSALEDMKKQNEFLIRINYYSIGDITFTYSLIGFQSALAKMKASCKFE